MQKYWLKKQNNNMSSTLEMPKDIDNEKEAETFIKYESSKEHYKAEACVVWCYDARYADLYKEFLSQRGWEDSKIDAVKGAGGAQAFAGGEGADRSVADSQIAKSIKLHDTEKVVLMVHMDCGGYGGSKAFDNDHQKEWDHHVAELDKAAANIQSNFPQIKEIECWLADFDGLHKVGSVAVDNS
jgi:carbonic anhydrase